MSNAIEKADFEADVIAMMNGFRLDELAPHELVTRADELVSVLRAIVARRIERDPNYVEAMVTMERFMTTQDPGLAAINNSLMGIVQRLRDGTLKDGI